jgi:hypothetical protein
VEIRAILLIVFQICGKSSRVIGSFICGRVGKQGEGRKLDRERSQVPQHVHKSVREKGIIAVENSLHQQALGFIRLTAR